MTTLSNDKKRHEEITEDPMLLTASEIADILKVKNLSVAGITEKGKLLELYYKNREPLPQRKYYQNRRGKLLTKKQNELRAINQESSSAIAGCSSETSRKKLKLSTPVLKRTGLGPSPKNEKTVKNQNGDEEQKKNENSAIWKKTVSFTNNKRQVIQFINNTITSNTMSQSTQSEHKRRRQSSPKKTSLDAKEEPSPPKKKHKQVTWP